MTLDEATKLLADEEKHQARLREARAVAQKAAADAACERGDHARWWPNFPGGRLVLQNTCHNCGKTWSAR